MRLEQLAVLIEVVKYKSLNLACVPLHMTQQTLSACIKSMERELGVDILKRSNKGISLTKKEKKVLAYALMVVPEYQKLLGNIAPQENQEKAFHGELRIYINSLFCKPIILDKFIESSNLSSISLNLASYTSSLLKDDT